MPNSSDCDGRSGQFYSTRLMILIMAATFALLNMVGLTLLAKEPNSLACVIPSLPGQPAVPGPLRSEVNIDVRLPKAPKTEKEGNPEEQDKCLNCWKSTFPREGCHPYLGGPPYSTKYPDSCYRS